MKKNKRMMAAVLAAVLSLPGILGNFGIMSSVKADSCGGLLEEDVYTPDPDEVIQDPILHWAVRSAMNAIKSGVKLTKEMVGDESVQSISYELCNHPEDFATWKKPYYVESLEGLQYAKSATLIDICYTSNIEGKKIKSLEPLAPLTQLDVLYLKQDGIKDISPLSGLVNLTQLDISGNYEISDLSAVENMTRLRNLNISINAVSDLEPIKNLSSLERLNAAKNNISTLPDFSALSSLSAVDLSGNQLTDVSGLAVLKNLEELNLSENNSLTDIRALAGLVNLKEDSTYMPTTQMKTDLFAVINVNKQFLAFNISKMTKEDVENVRNALDAYEDLTDEQKAYINSEKVNAAKSNLELVQQGKEPVYYPEYDEGGEPVPVFGSITIQAVDKNGTPMENVEFIRKDELGAKISSYTDNNGKITYKHSYLDYWGSFAIYPAGEEYVCQPEKIFYTVDGYGNTETVNGKTATGLEQLIFTLIPAEEYVDKSNLQSAISQADTIAKEEGYKYTEDSWSVFTQAREHAREVYDNQDASAEEVNAAAESLNAAFAGLKKTDILTKIEIIVKDKNGNLFTRPFKIQIRDAATKGEAWNTLSDARTGIAYINCSSAWSDGKKWEIVACYEEPYEFDGFVAVVGNSNGKKYFQTVEGQQVGVEYQKVITVVPQDKESAVIEPDGTVLKEYIENAKAYTEEEYTPGSWSDFKKALTEAQSAAGKSGVSQETYNQAAADLLAAQGKLQKNADKSELKKAIEEWYTESVFTPQSWKNYTDAKEAAAEVYKNENATQEQVDQAVKALKDAIDRLIFKPNKEKLQAAIQEAEKLKEEDYLSGYEELQAVLKEAKKVYEDTEATQETINAWTDKIEDAIANLEKKPQEIKETCDFITFRAVVQTEDGKKLSGISFELLVEGEPVHTITSDKNGIVTYEIEYEDYQKTFQVALKDGQGYVTEDTHSFKVDGLNQWIYQIEEIDGQPYQDGTRLVYTLKEGEQPEGEKILSDETAFRAKVVDENGMPLEGIEFESKPRDPYGVSYTLTSNGDGVIEQKISTIDYMLIFDVSLVPDQDAGNGNLWKCADSHFFETDGTMIQQAKVVKIDDKPLSEAGEIVFHLAKEGTVTPSVDKSALEAKLKEAKAISGDGYTEESYQKLQEAIKAAEAVYDKEDASEAEVAQQVEKLEEAIAALEKTGIVEPDENKTELQDWMSSASSYPEEEYTPETYAVLKAAMEKGQKVLDNPDATEKEINAAIQAIEQAIYGLEKADVPVNCERNNIRIKVVDENGKRVENGITFAFDRGAYGVYNSETYSGVIGYQLSTFESGIETIRVYLKNGSVTLDGKEYVTTPENFVFGIKSSSNEVYVDTIDGKPFEGPCELVFTLKEKAEGSEVNKTQLQKVVGEAGNLLSQEDSYTVNSFAAFMKAYEQAKEILEAETAEQGQVDQAAAGLESAIHNLKKVEGVRTLQIPVRLSNGGSVPANVEFVRRDLTYSVNHKIFVNGEAGISWTPGSYDSGEYAFFLPDSSSYIATPEQVIVKVGKEDGTSVIESINGVPAAEADMAFVLSDKGTDTCDLTHFRAIVKDTNGNLLSGVKFNVVNGDPAEIVSNDKGVIEYEASIWDTDTTMTVVLQDGQGWTADKTVEFSVIADPADPSRAILETINGQPFQGGESVVIQLQKEESALDWTSLQNVMEQAGKLSENEYTAESFVKMTEALAAARQIFGDETVTQAEIDQAAANLEATIQALEKKPAEPEEPQYSIIQGAGQQVTAGKDAVFSSSADLSKFVKVLIDGTELSNEYYTVTEGSTIITLKREYLATLKEGKHTISIVSTDGTATADFTVAKEQVVKPEDTDKKPQNVNPSQVQTSASDKTYANKAAKTGDSDSIIPWSMMGVAALCIVTGIMVYRRKRNLVER